MAFRPVALAAAAVLGLALPVVVSSPVANGAAPAPAASAAQTYDTPYLNGLSGPVPTQTVDLAGTWNFQTLMNTECHPISKVVHQGPQKCTDTNVSQNTTIAVPGGGWTAQGFDTLSKAIYSRSITVPAIGGPQAVVINLGGVGNSATLAVNGTTVGTQTPSGMPASWDISKFTQPGGTYTISITVTGERAFTDGKGYFVTPFAQAQGIFRSAQLQVFPAVYLSATSVVTSVANKTLTYNVSVTNTTDQPQIAQLSGSLASWNGSQWPYPALPTTPVTVPANTTQVATVGPIAWGLGAESYWWPNVPYKAGYRAQLHNLSLQLTTPGQASASATYRFGFREIEQVGEHFELNGVRVNFRGDDEVQRANDGFDTNPSYGAPTSGNAGWPAQVDRYLRLNYNEIRVHEYAASPYMLDVTDERGLMVMDESGIYGSGANLDMGAGEANMEEEVRDMVLRDLNHGSVLRWSEANEPDWAIPGVATGNLSAGKPFQKDLYDTIRAVDSTRPVSVDAEIRYDGQQLPQFTVFCHYAPEHLSDGLLGAIANYTDSTCKGRPGTVPGAPYGQGEFIWPADGRAQGFLWFATSAEHMRLGGAADIRPYTLVDAWPGIVSNGKAVNGNTPVVSSNPWSNRLLKRVQDAFSPLLVADTAYWTLNERSDDNASWPVKPTVLAAGHRVTRHLQAFNDTFSGTTVTVHWSVCKSSASGPVVASGTRKLTIKLGSHAPMSISFKTLKQKGAKLVLTLTASKPGTSATYFKDSGTIYQVSKH
jgi:hypothetical protein